jgi:hypothetical protein
MMKEIKNIEEAIEYFDEVKNRVNGKFQLAQIYGAAKREFDLQEEKNQIKKLFGDDDIKEIIKINESLFLVLSRWKTSKFEYTWHCVVNGKKPSECWDTLEAALVGLVSYSKTGRSDAGFWAMKMIDSVSVKGE